MQCLLFRRCQVHGVAYRFIHVHNEDAGLHPDPSPVVLVRYGNMYNNNDNIYYNNNSGETKIHISKKELSPELKFKLLPMLVLWLVQGL